jgi:hypothetical protein
MDNQLGKDIQMALYGVATTVVKNLENGYTSTRQLPTFYLSGDTQGIVSESHAMMIVSDIFAPFESDTVEINYAVVKVES